MKHITQTGKTILKFVKNIKIAVIYSTVFSVVAVEILDVSCC
jgi:hypothetical protein